MDLTPATREVADVLADGGLGTSAPALDVLHDQGDLHRLPVPY